MYHHSLITVKATLEDEVKKIRFMEYAAGTSVTKDFPMPTSATSLTKTWHQETKGVGKWPPASHSKDSKALPSTFTQAEVHTLVQLFRRVKPRSSHVTRATTLATFVERKDGGPMNVQTRLASQ